MINTVWTCSTDTDNGLETSVHTAEGAAWLELMDRLFGKPGEMDPEGEALFAEAMSIWRNLGDDTEYEPLRLWLIDALQKMGSVDSFLVASHDLPCALDRDTKAVKAVSR